MIVCKSMRQVACGPQAANNKYNIGKLHRLLRQVHCIQGAPFDLPLGMMCCLVQIEYNANDIITPYAFLPWPVTGHALPSQLPPVRVLVHPGDVNFPFPAVESLAFSSQARKHSLHKRQKVALMPASSSLHSPRPASITTTKAPATMSQVRDLC